MDRGTTREPTPDDLGGPSTFLDRKLVGEFAVSRRSFERGDPAALFRVLIAMTLFQRRQDQQVLRILRGLSAADVRLLTDVSALETQRLSAPCKLLRSSQALHERCDLAKAPGATIGTCSAAPQVTCHLKRHTVLLKRYGHFGKVPTSAALMLSELGVRDLRELRALALASSDDPAVRARFLEEALMRVWRVSRKISAMFLSAVCNPDLGEARAPWAEGVDWTHFVVIDSNTDLFLDSLGFSGLRTYDARLAFIIGLARRIDLSEVAPHLHSYNPRLVQQAMYVFMSRSNRRSALRDCAHERGACQLCPRALKRRCPVVPGGR